MKAKILTSSLVAILLLTTIVIATVGIMVSPSSLEFLYENQSQDFTITNTGDEAINITIAQPDAISDGTNTVAFLLSDNEFFNLEPGNSEVIGTTSLGNPQNLNFGIYESSSVITAINSEGDIEYEELILKAISSFCSEGPQGNSLEIPDIDIDNLDGHNSEWELMDDIIIEVEVENVGYEEINEVILELGLFDLDGVNFANNLEFSNNEEEMIFLGNLNDGESEIGVFVFRVPADFEVGNYKLALKAYSDETGEDFECVDFLDDFTDSFFEPIEIDYEQNVLCPSDIHQDGVVDDIDLDVLLALWGTNSTLADINNDGIVNVQDLLMLLADWGPCEVQEFTDVAVTDISISPKNPMAGDTIHLFATIQNLGDVVATSVGVGFTWTNPNGQGGGGGGCCFELEPNESQTISIGFGPAIAGEYQVTASVDAENDNNPENNNLSLIFIVEENPMFSLNEVELNPEGTDSGNEWVELYSGEEIELEGYYLENNDGDIYNLNGNFSGYFIVGFKSQWLDNLDEKVYLKNQKGEIIDETPILEDSENNNLAWSKCVIGGWNNFVPATPGAQNICPRGGGGGSAPLDLGFKNERKRLSI